jgi:hypothetical protein
MLHKIDHNLVQKISDFNFSHTLFKIYIKLLLLVQIKSAQMFVRPKFTVMLLLR